MYFIISALWENFIKCVVGQNQEDFFFTINKALLVFTCCRSCKSEDEKDDVSGFVFCLLSDFKVIFSTSCSVTIAFDILSTSVTYSIHLFICMPVWFASKRCTSPDCSVSIFTSRPQERTYIIMTAGLRLMALNTKANSPLYVSVTIWRYRWLNVTSIHNLDIHFILFGNIIISMRVYYYKLRI